LKKATSNPNLPPGERRTILALSRIYGFGPARFKNLLDKFRNFKDIDKWDKKVMAGIVGSNIAQEISSGEFLSDIDAYEKDLKSRGICYLTVLDKDYPTILKEIYDPPIVLYYKGNFQNEDFLKCFAVVGTRNCTRYGIEVTKKIVRALCETGFVVVSGMAFGIDKLAHETAIESGGRTVAVLSGRVDEASPRTNFDIYERILERGCVLSECHLDWDIKPGMFSTRNRIISGLSQGTLVIEAGEKSGALITAYQALEQGREVFAVPADITNHKGIGTNSLIKKGNAKLVQDVYDILEEFGIKKRSQSNTEKVQYSKEEQQVVDVLLKGGLDINSLSREIQCEISKLSQTLTLMEIEKKVAKDEKGVYFITK
jgi:DNA processing protein